MSRWCILNRFSLEFTRSMWLLDFFLFKFLKELDCVFLKFAREKIKVNHWLSLEVLLRGIYTIFLNEVAQSLHCVLPWFQKISLFSKVLNSTDIQCLVEEAWFMDISWNIGKIVHDAIEFKNLWDFCYFITAAHSKNKKNTVHLFLNANAP